MIFYLIFALIIGCVIYDLSKRSKTDTIKTKMEPISSTDTEMKITIKFKGDEYDITEFAKEHPGGKSILLKNNGKEIEQLMKEFGHSDDAYKLMTKFKIN